MFKFDIPAIYFNCNSRLKREQHKKAEIDKLRAEMRAALPALTKEDIRRHRMDYYEAILMDLDEEKYASSASYLRQLIQFQEALRLEHGPDSKVWTMPRLRENKKDIDYIVSKLRIAEDAHHAEKYAVECDAFIELALHYAFGTESWWWLGRQFLIQCVQICSDYRGDGGRRKAKAELIYGKFALENLQDLVVAKNYLETSRRSAMGKSWVLRGVKETTDQTIFIVSCILLYKCLLRVAEKLMKTDPKRAVAICKIARRRAIDPCDYLGEADVLMVQGKCELILKDHVAAIKSFKRSLKTYMANNQIISVCEVRIQLALAYFAGGKWAEAMEELKALHHFAHTHELYFYEGQAYRFLGEYYLNQNISNYATPILIKALYIFHRMNCVNETDQIRNLAAISAGQELLSEYSNLFLNNGKMDDPVSREQFFKLLDWKNSREFFWKDDASSTLSKLSRSFKEEGLEDSDVFAMDTNYNFRVPSMTPEHRTAAQRARIYMQLKEVKIIEHEELEREIPSESYVLTEDESEPSYGILLKQLSML